MNRKLTESNRQLLLSHYQNGKPVAWIAKRFEITEAAVSWNARKAGLRLRTRKFVAEKPEVEDAYRNGKSIEEIAVDFQMSPRTARAILIERSVIIKRKYVSEAQADEIVLDYLAGKTLKESSGKHGFSESSAMRELARRGIGRRHRLYTVNEDYFSSIDTSEKALILGFISADGCVRDHGIQIRLKRSDEAYLRAIATAMGSNAPIVYEMHKNWGKTYHACRILIGSTRIRDDLISHGVLPCKSLVLKPWNGPSRLMRAYWKGVWDGDGHVFLFGRSMWNVGLTGNKAMVAGFERFIRQQAGLRPRAIAQKTQNCWKVNWTATRDAQSIIRVLFSDSPISLERKKVVAERLLAVVPHKRCR